MNNNNNKDNNNLIKYILNDFIIGGISSSIIIIIESPLRVVRLSHYLIRTGVHTSYPPPSLPIIQRIFGEYGIIYFWKDCLRNIFRGSPFVGLHFSIKDYLRRYYQNNNNNNNNKLELNYQNMIFTNFIFGGIAGFGASFIMHPINTYNLHIFRGERERLPLYTNFGRSLTHIIPYRSISFGIYDSLLTYFPKLNDNKSLSNITGNFSIALFSTMIAGYFVYPIEIIKRRYDLYSTRPNMKHMYNGMGDCFIKVFREEGIKPFFHNLQFFPRTSFSNAGILFLFNQISNYYHSVYH